MKTHIITPSDAPSYPLHMAADLLPQLGQLVEAQLRQRHFILIADDYVMGLHGQTVLDAMIGHGHTHKATHCIPQGEGAKSFTHWQATMETLLALKPDRQWLILALGGGVCGDHAGFAAASLLRGVDFVQIPTSLLAQVDSSIGGKTGINSKAGKNLIGAFHQPRLVVSDLNVLQTLDRRNLMAGYAELVKHALIADADLFAWLEIHAKAMLAGDQSLLAEGLSRSCVIKADIVARDSQERNGARALLNFGHTFAHALEADMGYDGRILHGEAVALGMLMALEASQKLGMIDATSVKRVHTHFTEVGLMNHPGNLPFSSSAVIWDLMQGDKKVENGAMQFILLNSLGDATRVQSPDKTHIIAAIEKGLAV